ncbi:uncharacterized protein LOC107272263 [Cephus cinctus]|uniref:Uncharacterized protein LOC107272263 n=1 Tax=Cephus cinctus TaxID=211228 RepID=A0AAJ7C9K5_CEPCN|nr:uncharacterized protein LOC107272263 [Cephus cinctus]
MVEGGEEYVLHWPGHAGHVTERFSGLLARQALVDVTLICEEQKLRVHKLVLASCSLYFEEMLEQDLGQEPIILLSDLNFEILKAMVEFMYCGETTISQEHLPSLLEAAKIFKVKELACIAGTIMDSQNAIEKSHTKIIRDSLQKAVQVLEFSEATYDDEDTNIGDEDNCVQVRVHRKLSSENHLGLEFNGNSDIDSDGNQSPQSSTTNCDTENDFVEHTLYEETCTARKKETSTTMKSAVPRSPVLRRNEKPLKNSEFKVKQMSKMYNRVDNPIEHIDNDIKYNGDSKLEPILYEQCCDFFNTEQTPMLMLPCNQKKIETFTQQASELTDIPSKLGKGLKVYTHKRRKSADSSRSNLAHFNSATPELPTANCIDLLEESSKNDTPITLSTSLDMENTEYILSLSTENIETVVGCTIRDAICQNGNTSEHNSGIKLNGQKEKAHVKNNTKIRQMNELFSMDNHILSIENSNGVVCKTNILTVPALRRSTRLNNQDTDDSVNNNDLTSDIQRSRDKHTDTRKDHSNSTTETLNKLKRKVKESEQRISDENTMNSLQSNKRNSHNTRTLRSSSKSLKKNANKSRLSLVKSNKSDQRSRNNSSKLRSSKIDKLEYLEVRPYVPAKLNTIASVNRALWGDMSDILEDRETGIELPEYSPSKEIPFAVGLLPLRAALERMQAMPDYQPRKTRSSVAPVKQETNGGIKRKNSVSNADSPSSTKRTISTGGTSNENSNTICHIQISTTSPQTVRSRKRLLSETGPTVESSIVGNKR